MAAVSASSHGQAQQGVTDVLMENTGMDFKTFYTWASNGWPVVATLEKKRTSLKTGDVEVFYVREPLNTLRHIKQLTRLRQVLGVGVAPCGFGVLVRGRARIMVFL